MEILWFSTNMCGDSHSFTIPDYIWNDKTTYPKYQSNYNGWWWGYYGYMGLLWQSNPALLKRQTNAIRHLMDFVYDWDNSNGKTHIVIGAQLFSEPDAFPRWRLSLQNIKLPDGCRNITEEEAWYDVCTSLDSIGKAFKESNYSVLTRTNLIQLQVANSNWENFAVRIFNLNGVDAVGNDSYTTDINSTRKSLLDLAGKAYNYSNFAHIAENKGSYFNTPSLITLTMTLGGGYNMYDIATPKYFIDNPGNDAAGIDQGILTTYNYLKPNPATDLQDKPHTQETRVLLHGLKDASYPLIMTKVAEIAGFNIACDTPLVKVEQNISTSSVNFHFKTTEAGVGFGMAYNSYVILFSTRNCEMTLDKVYYSNLEFGNYNYDGVFTSKGTSSITGNVLNLEGGKVYRVKIDSLKTMPENIVNYPILNFEDEDETLSTIVDLHTSDWQTNTAYTRNTYALNSDKTGVDQTDRCATFSGYNSANEWWYGMDIVLATPITLTSDMTYLHAAMMTNNTSVDTNRGLILRSSAGGGTDLNQTWQYITDKWADFVFPIPSGAADLMELRFMFNHQIAGEITFLDEIVVNNDPTPRTLTTTSLGSVKDNNSQISVYSGEKSIYVISSLPSAYVEVYDILGRCIFSQNISGNKAAIFIKESGMYLVKCNQSEKKLFVH